LASTTEGKTLDFSEAVMGGTRRALAIDMPRVIPPGESGDEWLMWFQARDNEIASDVVKMSTGRVLFATSKNGIDGWRMHEDSPILGPNKENGDWFYFDAEHVGLGDVIKPGSKAQSKFATQDGVFLMYIFGGSNTDAVSLDGGKTTIKGQRLEIGVAVSQDGAHWSRVEGPTPYGSILEPGKPSDFDGQFVGWPCVIEVGSEYRMYYHTYDPRTKKFSIGLAVNKDGLMNWNKRGVVFQGSSAGLKENDKAFDSRGASRRHVLKMSDGTFRMWYEGIDNKGVHSIGCAVSNDGYQWTSVSDAPVFTAAGDADAWDAGGVGSPHLVWLNDLQKWRMYYVGFAATGGDDASVVASSIGVAQSTDEMGTSFVRIGKK